MEFSVRLVSSAVLPLTTSPVFRSCDAWPLTYSHPSQIIPAEYAPVLTVLSGCLTTVLVMLARLALKSDHSASLLVTSHFDNGLSMFAPRFFFTLCSRVAA